MGFRIVEQYEAVNGTGAMNENTYATVKRELHMRPDPDNRARTLLRGVLYYYANKAAYDSNMKELDHVIFETSVPASVLDGNVFQHWYTQAKRRAAYSGKTVEDVIE